MQETNIGWTDFSANLLKYRDADGNVVHACVRISEGCRFCYACALAGRWGRKGKDFTAENMKALTPFFDTKEADQIVKSKKIAGKKVFVGDMTDLFGEWVSEEIIRAHFTVFAARPDVTFQVLTKRAKRMSQILTGWKTNGLTLREGYGAVLPNVHVGVSVEDQENANRRLPWLLETSAAVRWVSIEPMLGQVDLQNIVIAYFKNEHSGADYIPTQSPHNADATSMGVIDALSGDCRARVEYDEPLSLTGQTVGRLDGIVIGGETGAGHGEMPLVEALVLAESARAAGVSVYVKQDSGPRPGMQGRIPDDVWAMKEWPTAA